jgi:protein YIPF6
MAGRESVPAWANPNQSGAASVVSGGIGGGGGAGAASQQGGGGGPPSAEDHESELFRPYSTLDEPVSETIMRDVRAVASKLRIVLSPLNQQSSNLFSAAAYGLVSTVDQGGGATSSSSPGDANGASAATTTAGPSNSSSDQQQHQQLSDVDRQMINELKDWDLWGPLVLCLTLAVTLSFKAPTNQSSMVFAAVFCAVWIGSTVVTVNAQLVGGTISFFQSVCVLGYSIFPLTLSALVIGIIRIVIDTWAWIDLIIIAVGFAWAIRTSSLFVSIYVKPERRFLALYPVFFFYVFLSWMIFLF